MPDGSGPPGRFRPDGETGGPPPGGAGPASASAAWADALLAARVLSVGGPSLAGIHVRARCGPVLDAWLERLRHMQPPEAPWRRLASTVPPAGLTGGLDLTETLARGRPVRARGALAACDGGLLVLAMAERTEATASGILAATLDTGRTDDDRPARFALVALDEGAEADEGLPPALADRLSLRLTLDAISLSDAMRGELEVPPAPRRDWHTVALPDELLNALVAATADAPAARSPRRALALSRVTRILAALDDASEATPLHAATALRLVFGLPPETASSEPETAQDTAEADADPPPDTQPDAPPPDTPLQDSPPPETESGDERQMSPEDLQDMLVAVMTGHGLDRSALDALGGGVTQRGTAGKSGAERKGATRGRAIGIGIRPVPAEARPNVTATLRAAAPWQRLRRAARAAAGRPATTPILITPSDFRYLRHRHRTETTAVFAVDASGSTAIDRLGEAKGAIELLLADCYVRRDQIALIAFRGRDAEVLLEPTRSLVRAKRNLTGLPGGGPTPLAHGLQRALDLGLQIRRKGQSPLLVLFTDGRGNIALDGSADRAAARADVERLARQGAALGLKSLVIDIARRPRDDARSLAQTLGADYRPLPRADAASVSRLVSGYLKEAPGS